MQLVSAASQSLIHTVGASGRPTPLTLPAGLPLPRRSSEAWCARALAASGETYLYHALVTHIGGEAPSEVGASEAIVSSMSVDELLMSNATLYWLRGRRTLLALSTRAIERLEVAPQPGAPEGARRVLAVFVAPSEAARRAIPSCLQYSLPVHEALAFVALLPSH